MACPCTLVDALIGARPRAILAVQREKPLTAEERKARAEALALAAAPAPSEPHPAAPRRALA
jgi:hypothetical protein